MPGSILSTRAGRLCLGLVLGALAFVPGPHAAAAGGTAQVSTEIPGGKTKTVRLRNLPRGTSVTVRIDAEGRLGVVLISRAQLKSGAHEAVFKGVLERRMTFKVVIPESDDYYLVLDNRRGDAAVKARATIRAVRESTRPDAPSPTT